MGGVSGADMMLANEMVISPLGHLAGPGSRTATGPVQMWPGGLGRFSAACAAASAGGTTSGG